MGFTRHDNASLRCSKLKNGAERAFFLSPQRWNNLKVFFTVMLVDAPLEEDSTVAHLIKRWIIWSIFEQSVGKWSKRSRAVSQTLSEDMRLCACKSSVAVRLQRLNRPSLWSSLIMKGLSVSALTFPLMILIHCFPSRKRVGLFTVCPVKRADCRMSCVWYRRAALIAKFTLQSLQTCLLLSFSPVMLKGGTLSLSRFLSSIYLDVSPPR